MRVPFNIPLSENGFRCGIACLPLGGARFASLASQSAGYGNLTLTPELQAEFVREAPEISLPIPGDGESSDTLMFAWSRRTGIL
jgi:hypothetical protein